MKDLCVWWMNKSSPGERALCEWRTEDRGTRSHQCPVSRKERWRRSKLESGNQRGDYPEVGVRWRKLCRLSPAPLNGEDAVDLRERTSAGRGEGIQEQQFEGKRQKKWSSYFLKVNPASNETIIQSKWEEQWERYPLSLWTIWWANTSANNGGMEQGSEA